MDKNKKRVVLGYCLTTAEGKRLSETVYKHSSTAEDNCFTGAYVADYVDYIPHDVDVDEHIRSLDLNLV